MKISYTTLLILIAATSLASAGEVPKEGTYDYTSCWSGTTSTMQLPGGAMAATNEVTGMNHAKIPGTMFDNSSFRCIGFTVTKDKYFNPYFIGWNISMPPPCFAGTLNTSRPHQRRT